MRLVPLANNRGVAIVDDGDFEMLSKYSWWRHGEGYACAFNKGGHGHLYMHRLIMAVRKKHIDHIDGDGLNNRRCNLRVATRTQNNANQRRHRDARSPYKGLTWHIKTKTWQCRIRSGGKVYSLGYFKDPRDGALAYNEAAKRIFGAFARINEI